MKKTLLFWAMILIFLTSNAQHRTQILSIEESIDACRTSKLHMPSNYAENSNYDAWDLTYQKLNFEVDPSEQYISGMVSFHFTTLITTLNEVTIDVDQNLAIDSITSKQGKLNYTRPDTISAIVEFAKALTINEKDSFIIYFHGAPTTGGFGSFTTSLHEDTPILSTLSEPYGARDWWPCKQSLIDKIDSIDIVVSSPEQYRTASNGVLISDVVTNGKRTCHWQHRHPIATYLVAIAVTNYATYSETATLDDGTNVNILNYVYPENLADAQAQTSVTKDFIEHYSSLFIPYPFADEKYGHAQFAWGGGMEHQTMSFMGGFSVGLIAHELAHQWFGDYITCGSWGDIWLNEGFATYLTGLIYEEYYNYFFPTWLNALHNVIISEPDGSVYVDDVSSVDRIFDSRLSYYKGAFVLHMLRGQLGDDKFFEGLYSYATDPRVINGFATTDLLFNNFETVADTSLQDFKHQWVYTEGYPIYNIQWNKNENQVSMQIEQSNSMNLRLVYKMKIPVNIWANGEQEEIWLLNDETSEVYQFNVPDNFDSLSIDYNNWMLKDYNLNYTSTPTWDSSIVTIQYFSSQNKIQINNLKEELQDLSIFNLEGQMILHEKFNDATKEISTTKLPEGAYIIRVKSPTDIQTIKLYL